MEQEGALLEQARRLDESALATIFDTYHAALYRYIFHHVGHETTAEDLTAEVFSRFLGALERGRGPERQLRAWLYRVAHNLIVDELRRRTHRDHENLSDTLVDDEEQGVLAQAQQSILYQQAQAALSELTDKQREVIILKFLEGLDNAEVAQVMEMTVGAVKALQNRGLAKMRRHLVRSGAVTEDSHEA